MIEIVQKRSVPGYDNNESFQNYYQYSETGVDLVLTECGYEKCDPLHYWEGRKGFHMIHVVISGRGELIIGNQCYRVQAGDAFYIHPRRDIIYRADENDPWEYRWVGFVGTKATVTLNETVLPHVICTSLKKPDVLVDRMRQIYECASQENDRGQLMALGHMYFFLTELLTECGIQRGNGDAAAEYVKRLRAFCGLLKGLAPSGGVATCISYSGDTMECHPQITSSITGLRKHVSYSMRSNTRSKLWQIWSVSQISHTSPGVSELFMA